MRIRNWFKKSSTLVGLVRYVRSLWLVRSLHSAIRYFRVLGPLGPGKALRAELTGTPLSVRVRTNGRNHVLYLRTGTTDLGTFEKIFCSKDYHTSAVVAPKVIVDAGSYTGLSPAWFAMTYPEAFIVALEPSSANYPLLQKNCDGLPNVRCMKVALWCEDTTLTLTDPGVGHDGYRIGMDTKEGLSEIVEARKLESIMEANKLDHIDILKIDIEGAEEEVFLHAQPWIGRVNTIMIECHDRFMPRCTEIVESATRDFSLKFVKGENTIYVRSSGQLRAEDAEER